MLHRHYASVFCPRIPDMFWILLIGRKRKRGGQACIVRYFYAWIHFMPQARKMDLPSGTSFFSSDTSEIAIGGWTIVCLQIFTLDALKDFFKCISYSVYLYVLEDTLLRTCTCKYSKVLVLLRVWCCSKQSIMYLAVGLYYSRSYWPKNYTLYR